MITPATSTNSLGSVSIFKNGANPDIAQLANGNFVAVWQEALLFGGPGGTFSTDTDGGVFARVFQPDGTPVSDVFQVNVTETQLQYDPQVAALSGGGFAITWTNTTLLPSGGGIDTDSYARVFDNSGAPVTSEIEVSVDAPIPGSTDDDNDSSRIIGLSDGGFVVTYSVGLGDGIEAQQYTAAGVPVGSPEALFADNTFISASAQLNNGDIVHVLDQALSPSAGYTLRISGANVADAPAGIPGATAPTLIETGDVGDYRAMRIAPLSNGGFVTATSYFASTSDNYFRIAIYDSSYVLNSSFDVAKEDISGASRYEYELIGLEEGGFVLTYAAADSSDLGLFGRAFTNDGTAVGGETLLLPNEASTQAGAEFVQTGTGQITTVFTDFSQLGTDLFLASATFGVSGTDVVAPITGSAGNDTLSGTNAADVIEGQGGDDVLQGGAGDDTLDGGAGSDTASYENAAGGVNVYLQYTGRNVGGGEGRDTLISIENLTGSAFDDRLIGDAGANVLDGLDGNDVLKGKEGMDVFFGRGGDDKIRGGADVDAAYGGDGSDILIGLSGNDILEGGDGRDFIYGGRDSDTIHGDAGDDELRGNIGGDTLFGGAGSDDIRGGGNNDSLSGGADTDYLFGENGNDTLDGGTGNDSLTGGAGADTFVFSAGSGFDRIKDWEDGTDQIDLTAFGFTSFATDVEANARDTASGLRIDLGGSDVIFIEGFTLASFDTSDVLL